LPFPIFSGAATLYLGENLGVIIRIGEACVFCHDADLRSFAEILQTSLNAVFLKISK